jgi:hypothetical protein
MLRRVVSVDGDNCPDDGGSKHLWNFGKILSDYTVQHSRRQTSSNFVIIIIKHIDLELMFSLFIYLFMYLFNDSANISDNTASEDEMISE